MDKHTLETNAISAFKNLEDAKADLFDAVEAVIEAKQDLENAKAKVMTNGVITGTNDKMRDAEMRKVCEPEYAQLAEVELAERKARLSFDRASTEVDSVKTLLRIAELA